MKNFFKIIWTWIKSFFPKKEEAPRQRTDQEIANDKYRSKYQTEYDNGLYYIQYYFNGEWWYLRLMGEDYTFEEGKSGWCLKITEPHHIENIITQHQEWLSGGRFFLPFR